MGLFSRKQKSSATKLGRRGGGSDDFDFGELEDMSGEFGDDHNVNTSRKATIKNYVTDHYKHKLTDRGERKKLLKQAMPASYSGPIDLASDLRDDYSDVKYAVGKEWDKVKSPLKKALKANAWATKFVPGGKRLNNWANEDERSRYQEEESNQDEALVQSMLAEFTSPERAKEREVDQKLRQEERKDESEYRSKSLSLQMQGAADSGNSIAELRKLVNYQDQVTFLYQKKSLEIGIRSLIEHRKQTDMFRVYKDESMAELKEIHKNTGLPEIVKTQNSEIASQIFKEKMIGSASQWFDGKFGTIRKRITGRIRDKLTEMTRDFGSSVSSFNEAMETENENGGSAAGMFGKMGADSVLNKAWEKVTGRPLNWVRGKLAGNAKISKFGRSANALQRNLGSMTNKTLLSGSSGNKMLDKFMDFVGLRQAGIARDDTMRQSLSKNLDTAAYMDIRFKQTVERVIPHWLSLIHKENRLMRVGWGFKAGDGENGTIKHEKKSWDWDKENLVNDSEIEEKVGSQILDRDRITNYAISLENLLAVMGSGTLTADAKEALKKWVVKNVQVSRGTLMDLAKDLPSFSKKHRVQFIKMMRFVAKVDEDEMEKYAEGGLWDETALAFNNTNYSNWLTKYGPASIEFAGKSLIDFKKMQEDINAGLGWVYEKRGLLNRNADGSQSVNMDAVDKLTEKLTRVKHTRHSRLVEGDEEEYKDRDGTIKKRTSMVDSKGRDFDEILSNARDVELDDSTFDIVQRLMDATHLGAKDEKAKKEKLDRIMDTISLMTSSEANKRGLLNRKASGGYAGRFSKGGYTGDGPIDGPIQATLDGKEFVNDAVTTEKNKALLEAMNKLKAPVILPDGTVNPVYYKAFGFKNEFDFKEAHRSGDQDVMDLIASTKAPKKDYGKAARSGLGKALKWANSETKPEDKAKRDKALADGKKLFTEFKMEVRGHTDEQLQSLFLEISDKTDHSILTDADWDYFAQKDLSWANKIQKLLQINMGRGNGVGFVKGIVSTWSKDIVSKSKARGKRFINGSDTDTTNTDELAKLGGRIKGKVRSKLTVKSGKIVGKDLVFCVETSVGGVERIERLFSADEMRAGRLWIGIVNQEMSQAVPMFLTQLSHLPPTPSSTEYTLWTIQSKDLSSIPKETFTNAMQLKDISVELIAMTRASKDTWVDQMGKPIDLAALAKAEIEESNKREFIGFNKDARSALVNTAIDKMRLKKAKDLAMKMWKDEAVDIYLIGSTTSPRLTAIGFASGDYVDKNTGRVCSSHHDITGDVTDKDGNVLLTFAEAEKGFCDKNGEAISINVMKQYRNIAKDEAKKLYDKYGKKHVKRLAGGMLTLTEKWQNLFKKHAINVYVGDETSPRLVVMGFNEASYFSEVTKKPLKGWMDIDGPVLSASGTVIISAEDLETKPLFDSEGNQLKPPKLQSNLERLKGVVFKALSIDKVKSLAKKGWGKVKGMAAKLKGKVLDSIKRSNETLAAEALKPQALATSTASTKEGIHYKDPQTGAIVYMFNAQDMFDGLVYSVDPFASNPDESLSKITSFDYLRKGTTVFLLPSTDAVEGKVITWILLRAVAKEAIASRYNSGTWFDAKGKKLNAKKLKAMEAIEETAGPSNRVKTGFFKSLRYAFGAQVTNEAKGDKDFLTNNNVVYYKDPNDRSLIAAFNLDEVKNGQVYIVDPSVEKDLQVSKIASVDDIREGMFVYVVTNPSRIKEGMVITAKWLGKNAKLAVLASSNTGQWFDAKGKKLGKSFFSKEKDSIKDKVSGWKNKAKAMLSGTAGKMLDGVTMRLGSWQQKRAEKHKDDWIGKLAGAFGFGGKDKEKGEKKKGWLSKLLGGVGLILAPIVTGFAKLGSIVTKAIFTPIKWLANRMATIIVKPLLRGIAMLAKKSGSFLGKHGGKLMRGAGIAAAGYGIYDGLKGEEKLDADGNPILDKDGKPVIERNYGQAALNAGLGVAMIPGAMGAIGTGLAAAAGFLAPIALPLAAVAAVAYGGYKLVQWWKKKDAEKDLPITAFRMNQYGFSITDQAIVEKLTQLEATLTPFLAVQGGKANFKQDTDVEAVFTIFGLKYEGGDAEKNKKFLAWFLGRFKPVYISYVQAMNVLKNTTDLNNIEKKLSPSEAIKLLERVHFKNQSEMNPYNVLISPVDDPEECDYDFEDVTKRYDDTLEILKVKAADMVESGNLGTLDDAAKKEAKANETIFGGIKEGFRKGGIIGGLVGGSINALKMLGKGAGDIFNNVAGALKDTWANSMKAMENWITEKWEGVKAKFKGIAEFIANPMASLKKYAKAGLDKIGGAGAGDVTAAAIKSGASAVGGAVSSAYGNVKQGLFGSGKGGWHQNKPKELESWVSKYSQKYGVNAADMLTMAWVESKGNPEAKSPTGYLGVYQFGQAAAKDSGLAWGDVLNPEKNTEAAIKYAAMNRKRFVKDVGREPAGFEIYMMHQNGYTGYKNIALQAAAGAAATVGEGGTRTLMDNNGGQGMSPAQFLDYWGKRWNESEAAVNGGSSPTTPATSSTAGAKPTTSAATATAAGAKPAAGGVTTPTAKPGDAVNTAKATNVGPATSKIAQNKPDYTGTVTEDPKLANITSAGGPTPWMKIAEACVGRNEKNAVTLINEMHKVGGNLSDSQCNPNTPWCASFVGWVLSKAGIKGTGSAAAKSYLNFGTRLDHKGTIPYGAIIVVQFKTGNHVAFCYGDQGKTVKMLGGNQSSKATGDQRNGGEVTISGLGKGSIVGACFPPGYTPSVTAGPSSNTATQGNAGIPNPTSVANASTSSNPSAVNTGNSDINKVVNSGGGNNTPNVASAQAADTMAQGGVASILSKSLAVQVEMKSVLVEIRDCLVGQNGGNQELNKLKRPRSSEEIGADIGGNVANMLAERFGLGKPAETPKPVPIISASK